jgi:exonuclease III
VFLQETHCDTNSQANWNKELCGTTYYSNGSNHSCGVLTHIGKNLEFVFKDKVIDSNGRFIILSCEIQGKEYQFVNVYAPNLESQQVSFLSHIEECIATVQVSPSAITIWGGDFNCHLKNIDGNGGKCLIKKRSVLKIESIIDEHDLCDIWRLRNELVTKYTWKALNPLIQRRLDYFFISDFAQSFVSSALICNAISTDHSMIKLVISHTGNCPKGPSHWRLNTSLLNDEDYVNHIKNNLAIWEKEHPGNNPKLQWEYIKHKIREFSIKYSKTKAKALRRQVDELEKQLRQYKKFNCYW